MKNKLKFNKIIILIRVYFLKVSRYAAIWYEKATMTEHFFTIMMAIIIGVIGGFGAVIIRFLVESISEFFFSGHGSILERMSATPWYYLLLIPSKILK